MEEESKKPLLKGKELIVIRYVNPKMSDEILCKFPDYSAFGFDYSQSALWSPLVPRFHSLSCVSEKSPEFKRKISFDDDDGGGGGGGESGGCGGGIKRKVFGFGSKLGGDLMMKKKKLMKKMKFDCCKKKKNSNNKSRVSDFSNSSPNSSNKGWKKALKITSKQFKKKKDHQILHNYPKSRITLGDYLQYQNS